MNSVLSSAARRVNFDALRFVGPGNLSMAHVKTFGGGVASRTVAGVTDLNCVSLNGVTLTQSEAFLPTGSSVECSTETGVPAPSTAAPQSYSVSLIQDGLVAA
uniref:Uncharacterized protein n=1 Tax=Neobodo designis TaxID=312471 RepID=A0A7S1W2Z6_NEODS